MANYHHSKGIVLSSLKYGDSSRIVRVYTDGFGLLSFLVNSVGSKRGVVRSSMLLPLTLVELVHTHKGEGKLERIKEAKMDLTYTAIPYDPVRNAVALFLAELFTKSLREEEANEVKFEFVRGACLALDTLDELPAAFHLAIWAKLTQYLGFGPEVKKVSGDQFFDLQDGAFLSEPSLLHPFFDAATSQHLRDALAWDFEGPLHIPKAGRRSLLEGLERFMNIHLDGFGTFKSLEVLGELFA
jgi:DNA repair protein RecO (recombination protein O)